jgi:hypothetical protein
MGNLIQNQAIIHNNITDIENISYGTLNFSNINNDRVHKNHNYIYNKFSHKYRNLKLLHQNLQGFCNKTDEFLYSLSSNSPQVICITEHHSKMEKLVNVNFGYYTLGAFFCRQTYKHRGVCILVPKKIQYFTIDLDKFNMEKDFEVCALKLNFLSNSFTIICLDRSPTGNFSCFIDQLESLLNKIYKTSD